MRKSHRSSDFFQKGQTVKDTEESKTQQYHILALKLRRILKNKVKRHFRTLKEHRYQKFTLTLLEGWNRRALLVAFASILKFAEQKKQEQLSDTLESSKRPKLIFSVLANSVNRFKKDVFKGICERSSYEKNLHNFSFKFLIRFSIIFEQRVQKNIS